MNWLKIMFAGKKVMSVLTNSIPTALEDGKLSIDEIAKIVKQILDIFNIEAEIEVPEDLQDKYLNVVKKIS